MFKVSPLPRTLDAARRDFESEDERVRLDVVSDLARQENREAAPEREALLLRALRDPSTRVRRQAAVALADVGAKWAVPALLTALSDPEVGVRQMVVLALGELADEEQPEVLGRLSGLLSAGAPEIRFQALSAWAGLLGVRGQAEILAGLLDVDPEIRLLALRLIDEVLLPEGVAEAEANAALLAACRDPIPIVRATAQVFAAEWKLEAPRDLIPELVASRLRPREPRDEQLAIELCGELGLREAEAALRRRAFGVLGISLDPFAWPALTALARFGDPRAIKRIERALASRSPLKRNLALKAVGDARLVAFLPRLETLDSETCDPELLEQAVRALRTG